MALDTFVDTAINVGADVDFLRTYEEKTQAKRLTFRPMTVADRLIAFAQQGFRPTGIFVPTNAEMRRYVLDIQKQVGSIEDPQERLRRYYLLQDKTEELQLKGVTGRWTGQHGVARSTAPFRIVAWGRRSGKTVLAAHEGIAVARTRPRAWVWVTAPTMALVSRCFDLIDQMLADMGVTVTTRRNSAQNKLLVLGNGSRIEGISLEDPKSSAGAAVDFVILDEAAQIAEEAWVRAILPPLTDRNGQALLISSWEGEGDFFHTQAMKAQAERAISGEASDWEFFQDASWDVNFYNFPLGRNSPAIKRAEREMNTTPIDFLEQFGAIPAKQKNLVFPEFREKVHVGEYPYQPGHPVILAVDPSAGPNPYAVAVIQDYKDFVVIVDEFYEAGMTCEEISTILTRREWYGDVKEVIVDSAMPIEVERWVRMGWNAYAVPDKPQVFDRIPLHRRLLRNPEPYHWFHRLAMNELLHELDLENDSDFFLPPEEQRSLMIQVEERLSDEKISDSGLAGLRQCARFFVNKSCVWTIQEHKLYVYQKPSGLRPKNVYEKPSDKHNHLMDCIAEGTRIETSTGPQLIEAIRPGTFVDTRRGYRRVQDAWLVGERETLELRFCDGRIVRGTPEHRIWTENRGWITLRDLTFWDTVRAWKQKSSSTTASSIGAIRRRRVVLTGHTSSRGSESICTVVSGKMRTGRSRRAPTSTTETETHSTMQPRILSVLLPESTLSGIRKMRRRFVPTSAEFARWHRRGTPARRAVRGMRSMRGMRTGSEYRLLVSARGADAPTSLWRDEPLTATALGHAKQRRGTTQGRMTRRECVRTAENPSWSIATSSPEPARCAVPHLIEKRDGGRARVYDLSVAGQHEFFANGILVHNCIGYFEWVYHRAEGEDETTPQRLVHSMSQPLEKELELPRPQPKPTLRENFLNEMRQRHNGSSPLAPRSLVW